MTDHPVIPHDESSQTSSSLLARARLRDEVAWNRLVELYSPLLGRWFRRWGVRDADTENLSQDVFLAVAKSLCTFQRVKVGDTFRGWLHTIARNKFLDSKRQSINSESGVGGSDAQRRLQEIPSESEFQDELREDLRILHAKAVSIIQGEFSKRDWQIFQMAAVDGMSATEAAIAIGGQVSTNAVYLVVSRIKRRLREEFGELGDWNDETNRES